MSSNPDARRHPRRNHCRDSRGQTAADALVLRPKASFGRSRTDGEWGRRPDRARSRPTFVGPADPQRVSWLSAGTVFNGVTSVVVGIALVRTFGPSNLGLFSVATVISTFAVGDHRVSLRSSPAHGLATLRLRPSFFRTRGRCPDFLYVPLAIPALVLLTTLVDGSLRLISLLVVMEVGLTPLLFARSASSAMRQKALFLTGAYRPHLLGAVGAPPRGLRKCLRPKCFSGRAFFRRSLRPYSSHAVRKHRSSRGFEPARRFGEYRRMLRLSAPLAGAGIAGEAYGRLDQPLLAAFRGQRVLALLGRGTCGGRHWFALAGCSKRYCAWFDGPT